MLLRARVDKVGAGFLGVCMRAAADTMGCHEYRSQIGVDSNSHCFSPTIGTYLPGPGGENSTKYQQAYKEPADTDLRLAKFVHGAH